MPALHISNLKELQDPFCFVHPDLLLVLLIFDLLRAKGSIYGTRGAGRSWWRKLFQSLKKLGWVMSRLEAALFHLFDGETLVGILVSYVDDLYSAGTGH